MTGAFAAAMDRFLARLENADEAVAERVPADGGWTPAQIGWHVAKANAVFAGVLNGTIPAAEPAPPDFVEPEWPPIVQRLSGRLQAPEGFHPPEGVTHADAVARLKRSKEAVRAALAGLTPERGAGFVLRSPLAGSTLSLYQLGEWATAHVIKHNVQVKRLLEGGL